MKCAEKERIGLVLSGGGARGAYEAGVMSVLGPALDRRGERPSIYIGTSVGAVNATYQAAAAHLPADQEAVGGHRALAPGREEHGDPADPAAPGAADGRCATWARSCPSPACGSPACSTPSRSSATSTAGSTGRPCTATSSRRRWRVVGTVATAARTGRTVVFVEGHHERVTHRSHAIDYVPTRLDEHHVRASAAIPILFPPVRVDEPRDARGWYVDGGTRLNTPIKPALDLGAERLVVVATDSVAEPSSRSGRHDMQPPDFGDGALHVLQGMLVDPVVEDMRILGNINMFFADKNGDHDGAAGREESPRNRRRDRALPGGARQEALPHDPLHLHRAGEARRDRAPRARGVQGPVRRLEGPALGGLPAAQPAARRREPARTESCSATCSSTASSSRS